jgi:hypothetical protein
LEASGNRLTRGDAAIDYDAVHWRSDHGALQVGFRLSQRCLASPHLGFGMLYARAGDGKLGFRLLDSGLLRNHLGRGPAQVGERRLVTSASVIRVACRYSAALHQRGLALETLAGEPYRDLVPLRVRLRLAALGYSPVHGSLGRGHLALGDAHRVARDLDIRSGLLHAGVKELRIEQCNWLPLFDSVVMVDEDLLYLARHLRAHNDANDRLEGPRGDHFGDSPTATDLFELIFGRQLTPRPRRHEHAPKQEYAANGN